MKSLTQYTLLSLAVCGGLASCQKDVVIVSPESSLTKSNNQTRVFTITGDFETPKVVDLDPSEHRAFVLRPNTHKYPKVVLTDLATAANSFQPYFSSVWLYYGNNHNNWAQIYVEDNLVEGAQDGSHQLPPNASSSRIASAQKGVSRLLRHGNGYQFIVRFSAPVSAGKRDGWVDSYTQGGTYSMAIAIAPNTNGGIGAPGNSPHRVYAPKLSQTDGARTEKNPKIPKDLSLTLTDGDYVLANPSPTIHFTTIDNPEADNVLKLPVISDFLEAGSLDEHNSNHASLKTRFRMKGVLLSLKLDNKTGRTISVKRLRTRSNELAYSGFYELWETGIKNRGGKKVPAKSPAFIRATSHPDILRDHIYSFDLKNTDGSPNIAIEANSETSGRLYLWGGIDGRQPNNTSTKCQVIYEYLDEPGVEYASETLELGLKSRKFEEGTVYLVTVPINKPLYSGSFAYNDFDRRTNDWQ